MIQEIEIPREVPVMTLESAVLFPQAMMPLYIFEPRYRAMLKDSLETDRIFAVAALDEDADNTATTEPPRQVAGVGMIRACRTNEDGTSNLILQGLARVEIEAIVAEAPYRRVRIRHIQSLPGDAPDELASISEEIVTLVKTQIRLGAPIPVEVVKFLQNVEDAESALDLAIFSLCASAPLKQRLLETQAVPERFETFKNYLLEEIEQLKLNQKLKGDLGEDGIGNN